RLVDARQVHAYDPAHLARRPRPTAPPPEPAGPAAARSRRWGSGPRISARTGGANADAPDSGLVQVLGGVPPGAGARGVVADDPDLGPRSDCQPAPVLRARGTAMIEPIQRLRQPPRSTTITRGNLTLYEVQLSSAPPHAPGVRPFCVPR